MVTLLAYAPDERWAFAREGDRILLVRPPFQQDVAASHAEVERAVTVHGFVALERDFATRRALLDFLCDESVRVWREHAPVKAIDVLRVDLLAAFTVADLDRQLDRARRKIDAGNFDEAQTLLSRLLTAASLTLEQRGVIATTQQRAHSARREQEERRRLTLTSVVPDRFRRAINAAIPRLRGGGESDAMRPAA